MLARVIENPRLIALACALLVVAGLASLAALPTTEDPRVLNRVATVLAPFPGATPERVEALVAEPIEDALRTLPEVNVISCSSQAGIAVVRVELKDTVTETTPVWSEARDKLADVEPLLPRGALIVTVRDWDGDERCHRSRHDGLVDRALRGGLGQDRGLDIEETAVIEIAPQGSCRVRPQQHTLLHHRAPQIDIAIAQSQLFGGVLVVQLEWRGFSRIQHRLQSCGEREIASRLLGEWVMQELRNLDQVAYVRFASVYRSFQDVSEFRDEIERLERQPSPEERRNQMRLLPDEEEPDEA